MLNCSTENASAGRGQHSHEVPTVPGRVVFMRDGQHQGTSIWLQADHEPGQRHAYCFVSHDRDEVSYAARCVLVRGMNVEQLGGEDPHGCDLDTPDGLVLIGVDADLQIDEEWLAGGTVLWDSAIIA